MPIARSNINRINIQNFKFFHQQVMFDLNGNNLLLYGENGSGKSSLYWALYTLLECANKEDDNEIKKYFNPTEDQRLTNLFFTHGDPNWIDSEIRLELVDGTSINVSFGDVSIKSNADAQAANYATEFLNYKMLFRLHNFAHSDHINIFEYFEREVFPYVKFSPVKYWRKKTDDTPDQEKETENANQIWNFVFKGPPKTGLTKTGDPRYPLQSEAPFRDYRNIVEGFRKELDDLLTFINTEGNPILQTELKYNFTFKLELIELRPFYVSKAYFEHPQFSINLTIPLFGNNTGVLRPHTFLNEARLSALGLAIRFAILKKRLQDSKLKMAILDDFMISLDMKNRDVALDYILDKVAPNYQLLILSHDRYFYELAKDKIQRKNQTNWKYYQMFEDNDSPPTKLYPVIIHDEGKVNKAKALYKQKDFGLSANMIRQAAEKLCKAYLTNQEQLGGDFKPMKLDGWITKLIAKGTAAGLDPLLLQDLMDYKDRIMNPSSHYDVETPLFSNELEKAIRTMERLSIVTGIPL
jgi:energy-coupling factor transporter ATP-binding protein EcfA2